MSRIGQIKRTRYLYEVGKEQDVGGGRPHVFPRGIPRLPHHHSPRGSPPSLALLQLLSQLKIFQSNENPSCVILSYFIYIYIYKNTCASPFVYIYISLVIPREFEIDSALFTSSRNDYRLSRSRFLLSIDLTLHFLLFTSGPRAHTYKYEPLLHIYIYISHGTPLRK